ncbi:MAG: hypothetical protein ABSA47_04290 [Verrucomicrobiota bacterium]|jgi:hypothetical protein
MPDQTDLKTPLLEPLETTLVPATNAPLVIRDYFKKNRKVKLATVYDEFKQRFFDKTEQPAAETTYRKYKLLRISPDGPVIAELGGETKAEGSVAAVCALLERQGNGGAGFLQTNGYANIFYAKDKRGVLCAIRVGWADTGWVIDAIPANDPLAWNGKHQVFSPCPVSGAGMAQLDTAPDS